MLALTTRRYRRYGYAAVENVKVVTYVPLEPKRATSTWDTGPEEDVLEAARSAG